MKHGWIKAAGLAAGLAAATAFGAGNGESEWKDAVRAAFDNARAGLAEAPIGADMPVAVLPVHGDSDDGWVLGQANDTLVLAGKTCVVGKDEPMWDVVIDEIDWDRMKSDILDPETLDRLDARKLKSAKALMTVGVEGQKRGERRWRAAVTLRVVEIATKQYVWCGRFDSRKGGGPGSNGLNWTGTTVPLTVGLKVTAEKGAEMEADLLETWARGRLADSGFRVGSGKDDDVTLSIETRSELLDETPPYRAYAGSAKAVLSVQGSEARELGAKWVDARGAHGLLESEARRNLADALESQLSEWMKRTLDPEARKFAASRVSVTLANPIETKEDYKAIDGIQKGLAGLNGVRSAQLVAQDKASGHVEFLVVYDRGLLPTAPLDALWASHPELLEYVDE